MSVILSLLAAGSLFTLISGAPLFYPPSAKANARSLSQRDVYTYTVFGGDGSIVDGWPSLDDWVPSFEQMFEANKATMMASCAQFGVSDNSDQESSDIMDGIKSIAASTDVDPRFVLAIVMQESNGCVRAPTTNYGVRNPGLMQSHNGAGSCNNGQVMDPCPEAEIHQMIHDGTAGTSSGDGLQQLLGQATGSGSAKYYEAARLYNSGSISASGNLGQGIATHCYASDVANRLIGWASGPSGCDAATIGGLSKSEVMPQKHVTQASPLPQTTTFEPTPPSQTTPPSRATEVVVASTSVSTTPATVPSATTLIPVSQLLTSIDAQSSDTSCRKYYKVADGDYCYKIGKQFGISVHQFYAWNPDVNAECTNLQVGTEYCVSAASAPAHPSPPATAKCHEYYKAADGDACYKIGEQFGISVSQFYTWNPDVNAQCTNLQAGTEYCVRA